MRALSRSEWVLASHDAGGASGGAKTLDAKGGADGEVKLGTQQKKVSRRSGKKESLFHIDEFSILAAFSIPYG